MELDPTPSPIVIGLGTATAAAQLRPLGLVARLITIAKTVATTKSHNWTWDQPTTRMPRVVPNHTLLVQWCHGRTGLRGCKPRTYIALADGVEQK